MPASIFLWTTYLTSIWLWLYVGSGLLLRALSSVGWRAVFLRGYLNIQEKPLSAMGFVAGGLVACAWWGTCLATWVMSWEELNVP